VALTRLMAYASLTERDGFAGDRGSRLLRKHHWLSQEKRVTIDLIRNVSARHFNLREQT